MKNRVKLLCFVLTAAMLAACGGTAQETGFSARTGHGRHMQNQRLTICTENIENWNLDEAIETFEILYPEIEVTLVELVYPYGNDSENDIERLEKRASQIAQLRAEIMAGGGPDLFIQDFSFVSDENLFQDIGKTIAGGTFADLTPLLANSGYAVSDYYESIIDGCKTDGKQYIMPLSFSIPCAIATGDSLDKFGLDSSAITKDLYSYVRTSMQHIPIEYAWSGAISPLSHMQYPVVDYTNRTVDVDNETFRSVVELEKEQEQYLSRASAENAPIYSEDLTFYGELLAKAEVPFYTDTFFSTLLHTSEVVAKQGQEVLFYPIRNEQGQTTATIGSYASIRANSTSKEAAMKLILYLLEDGNQSAAAYPAWYYFPIRRESLDTYLLTIRKEYMDIDPALKDLSAPLTTKSVESIKSMCNGIETVKLQDFFNPHMVIDGEPLNVPITEYAYSEITYGEMIDKLETRLQFYMDE